MNRLTTAYLLAAALVLGSVVPSAAQTLAAATTLSAAIDGTQTTFAVASATGVTAGNNLIVDQEVMAITAVTGTTVTVRRGQMGTAAQSHANAERVYSGASNHFQVRDPSVGAACTRGTGDAAYQPYFNVRSGVNWVCLASGVWNGVSTMPITYNSTQNGSAG